ncbi:hypothetical protein AWC05_07700 [Mycobacterium florentinum]|uniref:Uncharacterized protein n=1 Tax=Mycobacterium florentinum TaxID=292462 RepID=A0A1X1TUX5_MYCFL|nr:hypothetical protein [Mycobacterium florentinum]MCV7408782.1 hypothetical protein [Mycobacterium florentinum]ORV48386.1 hypothetical protein AWC05_07700 [Mycobacterium florentinum]BBX77576.1 hypothetical protein MFLOJ_13630 [Mycobacterium florentinum]
MTDHTDDSGLTPGERAMYAALDEALDEQQAALERLAHDDPIGAVVFGDNDDWVDKRLGRAAPE